MAIRSLWPMRGSRSKSKQTQEKPRAPSMISPDEEAKPHRPSLLEFSIDSQTPQLPELDDNQQETSRSFVQQDVVAAHDVVRVMTPIKIGGEAPPPPPSPTATSFDHFRFGEDVEKPTSTKDKDDTAEPTSPASAASTATSTPSVSPSKSSKNPVASIFRTFSDAIIFTGGSGSPPKESVPSSKRVFPSWKRKFAYGSSKKASPPKKNSPLKKDSSPASAPTTTRPSSTLLPFNPWRSSSSSDSGHSQSSTTSGFSFPTVSLLSGLPPREAAENAVNNLHHVCPPRRRSSTTGINISRGSPYGELVVVDILKARKLLVDRDESGSDRPFRATMQLSAMTRRTTPASRETFIVNERFIFWLPCSPNTDQRTLDIFVHGGGDRDLGEVHLSLSIPTNETFADWYPLVCRGDGHKHGALKVALRRLVLTSSPMLQAGKELSARKRCLSFDDQHFFSDLLPELWNCFPLAEPKTPSTPLTPTEPMDSDQRFISYDLSLEPVIHRDVF